MTTHITGHLAITVADMLSIPLYSYTDPTAKARAALPRGEALAICREDPSLVYVDAAEVAGALPGRAAAVAQELVELARERGRGERLAVHGDLWGGACVVIAHPRRRADRLEVIGYDPERYPALGEACRVRVPTDPRGRDARG